VNAAATSELTVSGITCNNCARHVTEALQAVPGVRSVSVNVETRRASVRWVEGSEVNPTALLSALDSAGYPAEPVAASSSQDHSSHKSHWHANLWLGGIVTAMLMIGEWGFNLGMKPGFQWVSFALAGVVQVFAGAQFYVGAWRQLKAGSSNMDTLVALGSTTAFAYSTWALFTGVGGHLYFMEAASIITLISVGHWIEARVSTKASQALKSLLQLAPVTARRIQTATTPAAPTKFNPLEIRSFRPQASAQTVELEVPVADLQTGDLVALRPGDRVPVDGVVTEGESAVDESMLTGESAPVDKRKDAELYAGTANVNGRLVMRVTATGESTALAHIIAAVQRAQTSRADIQRLGDRISSVFVPIVVAIALGAALWWGIAPDSANAAHDRLAPFLWPAHPPTGTAAAFIIAAAVLIIACPCAMGLATPAAIMASANAAAKRGILIRDGVALEKAGRITAIAFDKTGTLTEGKPKVAALTPFKSALPPDFRLEKLETYAASLAAHSKHPLSVAVSQLRPERIALTEFKEFAGSGIQALLPTADGKPHLLQLGSLKWLEAEKIGLAEAGEFAGEWTDQGATVIGLAIDGRLVAVFALADPLKAGAVELLNQLGGYDSRFGLAVYIVSGDNARTVQAVANSLRLSAIVTAETFAEVRPEDKAKVIRELQARGERVAFVGDGINDAPALEQADLGIAVSKASDVAQEAADIILLRSDIEAIPEALGLARATLRIIKQNLFWAFFYNAVGVPLAALGFMSPVLCAAAMGFSDLIVIGNALRLLRRPPRN